MFVQYETDGTRHIVIVADTREGVNASRQLSTHASQKQVAPYLGHEVANAKVVHDEFTMATHMACKKFRSVFPGGSASPWRVDTTDPDVPPALVKAAAALASAVGSDIEAKRKGWK